MIPGDISSRSRNTSALNVAALLMRGWVAPEHATDRLPPPITVEMARVERERNPPLLATANERAATPRTWSVLLVLMTSSPFRYLTLTNV